MRKAFTLIEMLAVILILGIVALVVTPVVTKAINDARIGAFKRNVEGLEKAVDNKIALALLSGNVEEESYIYSDGQSTFGDLDKYFKGKRPDEAIFHAQPDGKVEYVIYDKDLKVCASKSYSQTKINVLVN